LLPSHCTESFGWYCKVESLGKVLPRETLNKYSMSEDTSGDSRLFAGEGARATLVQNFPRRQYCGSSKKYLPSFANVTHACPVP
jgi:hypothetical protein